VHFSCEVFAIYNFCLCRYVDVILQLIDKAGDFVSDDIWYRVVQFVTNNEDLQVYRCICCQILPIFIWSIYCLTLCFQLYQPYAAAKAREYLDKPSLHETMVKVLTS
jgi:AP-2 complex subunit alpha